MSGASVWGVLFGGEHVVVEGVQVEQDRGGLPVVVARVRPTARARDRCGCCGRRARRYDGGRGRRRWRTLDVGAVRAWLEADAPRVRCRRHGVVVAAVPWARHGAGHTRVFDAQVAWLAVRTSRTAVTELMRVTWRTVGAIVARVGADIDAVHDRLAGLRRIGIDEISYKRGHRYLTVVVDHDTRRLVWAAPGHGKQVLRAFFDALGPDRTAALTHVSADAADWIELVVTERAPQAVRCADPFHVVAWASDALDVVRRQAWNTARAIARTEPSRPRGHPRQDAPPRPGHERARALKGARWALWKNPEDLTTHQRAQLDWIALTEPALHRAYLLKEGLRHIFKTKGRAGQEALDGWIAWARRSRLPAFVDLARKIHNHRPEIDAALEHRLSQGLVESTNTKIRLLTRIAFGFHNPHALIALAMLALGGHRPHLPGRT